MQPSISMRAAALAAAIAGCAATQAGGGAAQGEDRDGDKYFTSGPGTTFAIKLEGPRFFGPELDISKFPDGYRGQVRGNVVDLRSDGSRITGFVATRHTDLHVQPLPDGMLIQGIFANALSRIELGPDRLKGNVGTVSYDFIRRDLGSLRYENRNGQGWLELPSSLVSRRIDEQAIWLMLYLGMPAGGRYALAP
jgi:hypothetical protein